MAVLTEVQEEWGIGRLSLLLSYLIIRLKSSKKRKETPTLGYRVTQLRFESGIS